jgi:hypothetical protein
MDRVTRWVCKKIGQKEAHPFFVKINVELLPLKKSKKILRNFFKLLKANAQQIDGNSSNLVTLT